MHSRDDVAARLRQERVRLGHNQADFGALAGVSRRTQAAYESGSTSPDVAYLSALAGAGADVHFIVSGNVGTTISPEESELLRRFRAAGAPVRAAVLAALGAGAASAQTGPKATIAGDAGQVIAGDADQQTTTIHMGEKRGRRR